MAQRVGEKVRDHLTDALLVGNWQAPAARPFYVATPEHPLDVTLRRRFRTKGRRLLDLARDRLADPIWMHRPVDRIAIASGIRDASGFYKSFRARFGETPGAFRPV